MKQRKKKRKEKSKRRRKEKREREKETRKKKERKWKEAEKTKKKKKNLVLTGQRIDHACSVTNNEKVSVRGYWFATKTKASGLHRFNLEVCAFWKKNKLLIYRKSN